MEIDPRSLPQLSKRLRDLDFTQKAEKTELQNLEQINILVLDQEILALDQEFLALDQEILASD